MPWTQDYNFERPYLADLRDDATTAETLRMDLLAELMPGHVLHGRVLQVIAIGPVDELIVLADSDTVALVYLRWSGQAVSPPYPRTKILDTAEHLDQHLAQYAGRQDLL